MSKQLEGNLLKSNQQLMIQQLESSSLNGKQLLMAKLL
jgi:hypothetical protein